MTFDTHACLVVRTHACTCLHACTHLCTCMRTCMHQHASLHATLSIMQMTRRSFDGRFEKLVQSDCNLLIERSFHLPPTPSRSPSCHYPVSIPVHEHTATSSPATVLCFQTNVYLKLIEFFFLFSMYSVL